MERKAEKESQVYVVSARDNFETMGYSTSVIWNIISGESAHFKEFASICRVFFSLLRRMVQKGCGIFSVAQMDYVTAGSDGGVASGGFAASASGHPMEIKRRGGRQYGLVARATFHYARPCAEFSRPYGVS